MLCQQRVLQNICTAESILFYSDLNFKQIYIYIYMQ
jgi:hypothetical protein